MRKGTETERRRKGLSFRRYVSRALTQERVFVVRSLAAAQMPLRFVHIQNRPNAFVQRRIDVFQPIRYVLMDGTFSDMQRLCRFPYRRVVRNDIRRFFADAILITVQRNTPICLLLKHMRVYGFYVRKIRC